MPRSSGGSCMINRCFLNFLNMCSRGKNFSKKSASRAKRSPPRAEAKTSWGAVADWYEGHLKGPDTYQEQVIAPQVTRLLLPQKGKVILEIGCGEGYFTRLLVKEGHSMVGCDISAELIARARNHDWLIPYYVASAEKLAFAAPGT